MDYRTGFFCCGLAEMSGISDHDDPKEAMRALIGNHGVEALTRPSQIIFTGANGSRTKDHPKYSEDFMAFIVENRLGTVTRSTRGTNSNSGNKVTAYFWVPNREGIRRWARNNA